MTFVFYDIVCQEKPWWLRTDEYVVFNDFLRRFWLQDLYDNLTRRIF